MTLTDSAIVMLAEEAGCPRGWYEGPWFDDDGNLKTGLGPCLRDFARLVIEYEEEIPESW